MQYQREGKVKIIGCNDAYRLCPSLDILYGADIRWWAHHMDEIARTANPKLKIGAATVALTPFADKNGIFVIEGIKKFYLSHDSKRLHWGGNSGFQIFNIAFLLGATRFFLLGYDYHMKNGKRHWFGNHPNNLVQTTEHAYERWLKAYDAPDDLEHFSNNNKKVYNCSLDSAIVPFEKITFEDALNKEFNNEVSMENMG